MPGFMASIRAERSGQGNWNGFFGMLSYAILYLYGSRIRVSIQVAAVK